MIMIVVILLRLEGFRSRGRQLHKSAQRQSAARPNRSLSQKRSPVRCMWFFRLQRHTITISRIHRYPPEWISWKSNRAFSPPRNSPC